MASPVLRRLLAASFVAVLLLAPAKCDVRSFKQHMEAEKRMKLMMDPTAVYEYFEKKGDITRVKPEFDEKFGHVKRSKRLTRTDVVRWEDGRIPYTIDQSYSARDRDIILSALSHYEEKTCLRFYEQTDEPDYLVFFRGAGCQSFIGKQSRQPQGVSLSSGCLREFNLVLHEIGHAIGLLHEHTRPDRDNYVDILYDNIYRGFKDQFEIDDPELLDTLGVGYDYNSVMHYNADAFANTSTPGITIVADKPGIPIGPGVELSKLDALKINILYQCPDDPPPRSTVYVPPSHSVLLPPITTECGDRFDGFMKGNISSPGFPSQVLTNQDCEWQIRVPTGFQIRFDIVTIDLDQRSDCSENYFEIYDNPDCTGFMATRRRRCSDPGHPFYSFSNVACVRYHSGAPGGSQDLTGLKIAFAADDENECFFPRICEHVCVNTPGGYHCTCPEGYFLSADGSSCFDVNECAMDGHMCEYKCENFGGYHECTCPDGSLQVGDSCAPSIPLLPTRDVIITVPPAPPTAPTTVPPTTPSVGPPAPPPPPPPPPPPAPTTVPPTTPTTIPTLSASCGGGPSTLTSPTGSIQTVGWPNNPYPLNVECTWDIVCPAGSKIEIKFEDTFRIAGPMPTCAKDSVTLSDCNGAVEHGPFCHLTRPAPFETTCNAVKVTFDSNGVRSDTRYGFKMNYACKTPSTVGPPTTVPTTARPTTPRPTTARPTTARPTTARPTTARPTTARPTTARPTTARPTTAHPTTAHPTTLPPTTQPPTLSLLCGGGPAVRRDLQGIVETLGWGAGRPYPINTVCQWRIECPSTQKVRLFFSSSFRIAGQMPSCSKDQLTINDCNGSITYGPFCHLTAPQPKTSTCNAVDVVFNTGDRRGSTRTGFSLNYECV